MKTRSSAVVVMTVVIATLMWIAIRDVAPVSGQDSSCGNGIIDPGEECDSSAGTPCSSPFGGLVCDGGCQCEPIEATPTPPTPTPTPSPTPTAAPTPTTAPSSCGNGIIDVGETCDPPGSPQAPNGNLCRSNCTFCGDSQKQNGETCDDGNGIDQQCFPVPKPERDGCNNNCTARICRDPARILFKDRGPDELKLHGLIKPLRRPRTATTGASITLENKDGVIYSATLPPGSLSNRGGELFVAKNSNARQSGGIALFRLIKRNNRASSITIRAYGDLSAATRARMKVTVTIGGQTYEAKGRWNRLPKGWLLPDVQF